MKKTMKYIYMFISIILVILVVILGFVIISNLSQKDVLQKEIKASVLEISSHTFKIYPTLFSLALITTSFLSISNSSELIWQWLSVKIIIKPYIFYLLN